MQVVRRDIKERRKQIHVVTLVHMQYSLLKQLTVIKPLVYWLRCPYCSGVMHL